MKAGRTIILTRHPGAVEFLANRGFCGPIVAHLDIGMLCSGDRVIGTLPINIAATLQSHGIEYWHLCVHQTAADRGRELSEVRLEELGTRIRRYTITEIFWS